MFHKMIRNIAFKVMKKKKRFSVSREDSSEFKSSPGYDMYLKHTFYKFTVHKTEESSSFVDSLLFENNACVLYCICCICVF